MNPGQLRPGTVDGYDDEISVYRRLSLAWYVYQSGHQPSSGKFGGPPTVYCRKREIRSAVAAFGPQR